MKSEQQDSLLKIKDSTILVLDSLKSSLEKRIVNLVDLTNQDSLQIVDLKKSILLRDSLSSIRVELCDTRLDLLRTKERSKRWTVGPSIGYGLIYYKTPIPTGKIEFITGPTIGFNVSYTIFRW